MNQSMSVDRASKRTFLSKLTALLGLKRSIIVEGICLWIIFLLLYTGVGKILNIETFSEQVAESPILAPISSLIVWPTPIMEVIIAIMLFFQKYRRLGLIASIIMMSLFAVYVVAIFSIDEELPCSCGGIIEELSWQGHLIFNIAMVGLAFLALRLHNKSVQQ